MNIGKQFLAETRIRVQAESNESKGLPQPTLELPYDVTAPLIRLPEMGKVKVPVLDVRQAIEQRATVRHYAEQALSLEELSFLLWASQGVKQVTKRPVTLRTVPSAGARHAFETYVLINRVEGLKAGLYRYVALEHALLKLDAPVEICAQVTEAALKQEQIPSSAVTFIWVAVTERMTHRYGQRGYRYLHLDAGHVCQNLYLAGEVIGCGTCAIGAFDEDELNTVLGLDGEALWVVYMASLGKRKTE